MQKSLEFRDIEKNYPGVRALYGINFKAEGGRVMALMGENGAGKSTLLKILSADIQPDIGQILINGEEVHFQSPVDAIRGGVSVIYQERQLFASLSVAENIFCGDLPSNKLGGYDSRQIIKDTKELLDKFGLDIDPYEKVGHLNVAHQQMVEIMKAYRRNTDIIAFDEPTAPLTEVEIKILFGLIKLLKEEGKVVLYVSHRMNEIFQVADDIVVLKDGGFVTQMKTSECNEAMLIKAMVGRDIGDTYSNLVRNTNIGDVLLEVKNLKTLAVHDVSFTLRKGEILGLSGLVGAGRTETVRAIFGADAILEGEIYLEGKKVSFKSTRDAIDHGIMLCPEDRKEQGLIMRRTIRENVAMPSIHKLSHWIFLDKKQVRNLAEEAVEDFDIKTPTVEKVVGELSGGNQQKVILGRWINKVVDTKILILDEPTKGIDVGTKAEIYKLICELACRGISIILISSELTEVINLADRVLVMHNGHITGEFAREDATEENVLAAAMLD
ncbi:MAG: sugar ABC transporter ATP-binding protein [Oscillospiraceae bacterium]|nr:sugar ABC transporter ATP-binding protein [Oscillospiraceae bacterium]